MMVLSRVSELTFYALFILGILIGGCAKSNGSYLAKVSQPWNISQDEQIFHKPVPVRIAAGLFGMAIAQLPLSFTGSSWLAFALTLLPCLFAGRLLLLVSSPDELRIDPNQHTFRRVRGWPFSLETWTGSLADLKCVYLRRFSDSKTGTSYSVGIQGARMGGEMKLGNFTVRDRAEHFAAELAAVTGLPVVPANMPVVHANRRLLSRTGAKKE